MTGDDEVDNGQRQTALIVRPQGAGQNLLERLSLEFYKLTWRTPLHSGRLMGKVPMRLLAVPSDPLQGDAARGQALRMGKFHYQGFEQAFDGLDYDKLALQPSLTDYIHRFDWLRDLSAATNRSESASLHCVAVLRGVYRPRERSPLTNPAADH
eukprot:gene53909-73752_t